MAPASNLGTLRLRPSQRSATSVRMLGNLFGGAPQQAGPSGTVVSKVFFDIEIGGAPAGAFSISQIPVIMPKIHFLSRTDQYGSLR